MDNKIFITLGSQKFQFNRLLKAVDELCEKGKRRIGKTRKNKPIINTT